MRYPASEKLEIIRAVETSHLPVRRTLDKIGIPKTTFYLEVGEVGLPELINRRCRVGEGIRRFHRDEGRRRHEPLGFQDAIDAGL